MSTVDTASDHAGQAQVNRREAWTLGFLAQVHRANMQDRKDLSKYVKRMKTPANRRLAAVLIGELSLEDADEATRRRFNLLIDSRRQTRPKRKQKAASKKLGTRFRAVSAR